jgi:hypothetical protein
MSAISLLRSGPPEYKAFVESSMVKTPKGLSCRFCDKTYNHKKTNQRNLRLHVIRHHLPPDIPRLKCPHCQKTACHEIDMLSHLKINSCTLYAFEWSLYETFSSYDERSRKFIFPLSIPFDLLLSARRNPYEVSRHLVNQVKGPLRPFLFYIAQMTKFLIDRLEELLGTRKRLDANNRPGWDLIWQPFVRELEQGILKEWNRTKPKMGNKNSTDPEGKEEELIVSTQIELFQKLIDYRPPDFQYDPRSTQELWCDLIWDASAYLPAPFHPYWPHLYTYASWLCTFLSPQATWPLNQKSPMSLTLHTEPLMNAIAPLVVSKTIADFGNLPGPSGINSPNPEQVITVETPRKLQGSIIPGFASIDNPFLIDNILNDP